MISVRQLTKRYTGFDSDFLAISDVSLEARAGQILGLLGPNGAGKTTLLRILATVLKPTQGKVTVNGFDVVDQADQVRRQIGFVTTNTAIYDRMTGWELVEFFGRLYGLPRRIVHARMEQLFDQLKMEHVRHVMGCNMSTGMRQKVSIARALIHDPPVLIFDEATAGLDVVAAREVLSAVERLRDAGKCIVFSSHVMSEVRRLCNPIVILRRGQIVASGNVDELGDKYGEPDLEELFYRLVVDPASVPGAVATTT